MAPNGGRSAISSGLELQEAHDILLADEVDGSRSGGGVIFRCGVVVVYDLLRISQNEIISGPSSIAPFSRIP